MIHNPVATHTLAQLVEKEYTPSPAKVSFLLKMGANPFAFGPSGERTIFEMVCNRAPHEECTDALFARVGDFSSRPWKDEARSPVRALLGTTLTQPPVFCMRLAKQLLVHGLPPEEWLKGTPSAIEEFFMNTQCQASTGRVLEAMLEKSPELLQSPVLKEFFSRFGETSAFERLQPVVEEALDEAEFASARPKFAP